MNAKQRRILIRQWVGQAYEKLRGPKYKNLRYRCFQRTGCLITADGSDDHLITPEGLSGYVVPPPLPMQSTDQPMMCDTPDPESPPPDDAIDEEKSLITETNDNDLYIDYEADRDVNHSLVGRQIRAFYDNGRFTGTITWYNQPMEKLRVMFDDETKDYISVDDIDGVEINLL